MNLNVEMRGKTLLLTVLLVVYGVGSNAQELMFSIEGRPAYSDEFEYVYSKNSFNNPQVFTRDDLKDYMELYINFKLKVEEARALGLDTMRSLKNEFESYKVQLQKPYLSDEKLTDSLVNIAYSRLKEEINAYHILIILEPDASPKDTLEAFNKIMEIRKMALMGEDFSELAATFSQDPGGKVNGGNLGYFTSMQMVYPFEEAAFRMKVGHISLPVRTRFGYHIIKVVDRRPSRGLVEAAHIMLRFKQGMTAEDSLAKRNQIFEIREQLQAGYNWDELVRSYSEDVSSNTRGGVLRAFRTGEMPPDFSEAVLSLENPGDISDPFTTPYGWHIVKLVNVLGVESFDEVEGTIRGRINSDARAELKQQALVEKIRTENSMLLNKDLLNKYAKTKLSEIPDEAMTEEMITVGGDIFTLSDVMGERTTMELSPAVDSWIIAWEKDHLEEKYPEYRHLLREYWEGILLFQVMDDMVWKKASVDSAGIAAFYQQNQEKYKWSRRIIGELFRSPNPETIDELIRFREAYPDSLDTGDLLDRFNTSSALNLRGYQGPFELNSDILPDDVNWEPGIQRGTDGTISWVIFIDKILEPGPRKLEESRGLVISDYQEYLEKKWVRELREKYDVQINKKAVKSVLRRLQK